MNLEESSADVFAYPICVIGIGLGPDDLTATHKQIIHRAAVLVAGRRLLAFFADHPAEKLEIAGKLAPLIDTIDQRSQTSHVVVLASGDPLYYGIGALLVKRLSRERVRCYPNITAVAAAFARLGEPWQTVPVVSLHGRQDEGPLAAALATSDTVAVYTDPQHNPAFIAQWLTENGWDQVRLGVLSQLGTPAEQVQWWTAAEARWKRFADPNVVVLKVAAGQSGRGPLPHLGMPEKAFEHEKGLITKAEVRAVTLAKLQLACHHVLWDLGAGSGSVCVEAALFVKVGRIIAVEKNPDRIDMIQANKRRYRVTNLETVQAALPDGLAHLPAPDRIFIGGGGKDLPVIIRCAVERLKAGGRVVINTVLLSSLAAAQETLAELGFCTDVIQILVNRGRTMPHGQRLAAENPVWIISASRD